MDIGRQCNAPITPHSVQPLAVPKFPLVRLCSVPNSIWHDNNECLLLTPHTLPRWWCAVAPTQFGCITVYFVFMTIWREAEAFQFPPPNHATVNMHEIDSLCGTNVSFFLCPQWERNDLHFFFFFSFFFWFRDSSILSSKRETEQQISANTNWIRCVFFSFIRVIYYNILKYIKWIIW